MQWYFFISLLSCISLRKTYRNESLGKITLDGIAELGETKFWLNQNLKQQSLLQVNKQLNEYTNNNVGHAQLSINTTVLEIEG